MVALVLALLIPFVVGFVAVTAFWPAERRPDQALVLKACLALGLALGITSWVYFLWLLVAGSPGPGFVAAESGVFALLLLGSVLLLLRRRSALQLSPVTTGTLGLTLVLVFALITLARTVHIIGLNALRPHSDGDAIFIWNMKARFLYRAGEDWRLIFAFDQPDNSRLPLAPPDYPLLIPANVARAWWYRGLESTVEPALISLLFTIGSVLLLYAVVSAVRGRGQGAVAGLALAATPWYIYLGSAQVADIPVSFYMLAAVSLFVLHDATRGRPNHSLGWVVLAGLMAGLAGWTKNEGCLFVVVLFFVRLLLTARRTGWRASVRESVAFLVGLVPFGGLLLYFRLGLVPSTNYLLAEVGEQSMLERLSDPTRYGMIAEYLFIQLFLPQSRFHFSSIGFIVLLAPVYRLFLGKAPDDARQTSTTPILVALLMLLGYLLVYLTTPLELGPHLKSSLHRLLMHIWPLALLWFALSTASPEEALTRSREGEIPPSAPITG